MASRIWKGSISFGLLNIPVALQTARKDKELHFSMLDGKDFAPIKFRRVNAGSGKEVPYSRIVKGFEYQSGEYVVLNTNDFKAANPKATQTIDIEDFVPLDEIDPMLFDKPYYIVPQKGAEKGYFLLRDALKKSERVAIGKIVIRTKQHLAAILVRGDYLVLETLHFAHEVLTSDKADYLKEIKKASYSPRELKMAQELIEGMTADWKPTKYRDTYYDDLMKRIKAKIKSGKSHTVTEADEAPEETQEENVLDLLPLLRRSLKQHAPAKKSRRRTSRTRHESAG